eukprot:5935137-Alexandrium_andersonii.AAC.1
MLEWPRTCAYWREARITKLLPDMGFVFADFDGCMCGLRPVDPKHSDKLIRKPWRIACLNSSLPRFLNRTCNSHRRHYPCEGRDAMLTQ